MKTQQKLLNKAKLYALFQVLSYSSFTEEDVSECIIQSLYETGLINDSNTEKQNFIKIKEIKDIADKVKTVWYSEEYDTEESLNYIKNNSEKIYILCTDDTGITFIYAADSFITDIPFISDGDIEIFSIYYKTYSEVYEFVKGY